MTTAKKKLLNTPKSRAGISNKMHFDRSGERDVRGVSFGTAGQLGQVLLALAARCRRAAILGALSRCVDRCRSNDQLVRRPGTHPQRCGKRRPGLHACSQPTHLDEESTRCHAAKGYYSMWIRTNTHGASGTSHPLSQAGEATGRCSESPPQIGRKLAGCTMRAFFGSVPPRGRRQ